MAFLPSELVTESQEEISMESCHPTSLVKVLPSSSHSPFHGIESAGVAVMVQSTLVCGPVQSGDGDRLLIG